MGALPDDIAELDTPQLHNPSPLVFHSTLRDLRDTVSAVGNNVLFLYNDTKVGTHAGYPGFIMARGGALLDLTVMSIRGQIYYNDSDFNLLIFVTGNRDLLTSVSPKCFPALLAYGCHPAYIMERVQAMINAPPQAGPIVTKDVIVFNMEIPELYPILSDQKISMETKILTVAYALFPHIRDYILGQYSVVTFHCLTEQQRLELNNWNQNDIDQKSNTFLAYVMVYMLAPSYTIDARLATQLAGRAAALSAAANTPAPTETIFAQAITDTAWDCKFSSPFVTDIMGRILAINATGDYLINVTHNQLLSAQDYAMRYAVPGWVMHLFVQMRLIYAGKHMTSLTFGINFLPNAQGLFEAMGGPFAKEAETIASIRETVINSPYLALVQATSEALHISKMPRPILFGVLMYQKTLITEKERSDFSQYNIDSISAHINPKTDIGIIKSLVASAPAPDVTQLVRILKEISLEYARNIMSSKGEMEVSQVLSLLSNEAAPGPWYLSKMEIKKAHMRLGIMEIVKQHVQVVITNLREQSDTVCDGEENPVIRKEKKEAIAAIIIELRTMGRETQALGDVVPPQENPTLQAARDQIVETLQTIYSN